MNTWRESILNAVVSTLVTASVASGRIFRSRAEALARDELPAIVIKPGAEKVDNSTRGIGVREFQIHIEVHARGNPADSIADPVVAALHLALMADQTLGGKIARLIEEETAQPEFADGDETAVMITATYTAKYATPAADNTLLIT